MSNSPEHNDQNAQSIPAPATSATPAPSVHLGADKGKLIAAIPSLLGFPPVDSMVIIGLVASTEPTEPGSVGSVEATRPMMTIESTGGKPNLSLIHISEPTRLL